MNDQPGLNMPVMTPSEHEHREQAKAQSRARHFSKQIIGGRLRGRNELCGCGSGLKFKKCHGRPVQVLR